MKIIGPFHPTFPLPLDSRLVVANLDELNAVARSSTTYNGMIVSCLGKAYIIVDHNYTEIGDSFSVERRDLKTNSKYLVGSINEILDKVSTLESEVRTINTSIATINNDIKSINSSIRSFDNRITTLENSLGDTLKASVEYTSLATKSKNIIDSINELEQRLNTLETKTP